MVAKKINPESLAPAIGFSHAVVVNGGTLVFLAGQTALNKAGVIEGKGIVEQFEKVITNLLTALKESGGTADNLVKLNIYAVDPADYRANSREIGKIWQRLIGKNFPAMTLVGVTRLWDEEALLEIEGVANL
ncbi:MAG: RidA family protein [Actinomycetes bacterium]|jgi:enamine deaminase RidA (YjgF/YER057c/UK114 family)